MFGAGVKRAVQRTHATRWTQEPWVLGAFSAAAPGGQWARRALAEPLEERLWFAGEAVHETLWGTLGGAWEAGEPPTPRSSGSPRNDASADPLGGPQGHPLPAVRRAPFR